MTTLSQTTLAWVSSDDRIFHLETDASAQVAADVFVALCGDIGSFHSRRTELRREKFCRKCKEIADTATSTALDTDSPLVGNGADSSVESAPIPCPVCVTQDICRDRGECVQRDAWPKSTITVLPSRPSLVRAEKERNGK